MTVFSTCVIFPIHAISPHCPSPAGPALCKSNKVRPVQRHPRPLSRYESQATPPCPPSAQPQRCASPALCESSEVYQLQRSACKSNTAALVHGDLPHSRLGHCTYKLYSSGDLYGGCPVYAVFPKYETSPGCRPSPPSLVSPRCRPSPASPANSALCPSPL